MIFLILAVELLDSELLKFRIVVVRVIVVKLMIFGDWELACILSIFRISHSWVSHSTKSKPEERKKN